MQDRIGLIALAVSVVALWTSVSKEAPTSPPSIAVGEGLAIVPIERVRSLETTTSRDAASAEAPRATPKASTAPRDFVDERRGLWRRAVQGDVAGIVACRDKRDGRLAHQVCRVLLPSCLQRFGDDLMGAPTTCWSEPSIHFAGGRPTAREVLVQVGYR